MLDSDETTTLLRIQYEIAGNRVLLAGWRLLFLWKANPDWHLQPRVPANILYQHFSIRGFDQNGLIEPLRAHGVELPYQDHAKWQ